MPEFTSDTPRSTLNMPAFPCPRCKQPSQWENNPSRPFCSERCKLIDLGHWADGSYTLPGDPVDGESLTGQDEED